MKSEELAEGGSATNKATVLLFIVFIDFLQTCCCISLTSCKAFQGKAKFQSGVTLLVVAKVAAVQERGGKSDITRPKQLLPCCHSVCTI